MSDDTERSTGPSRDLGLWIRFSCRQHLGHVDEVLPSLRILIWWRTPKVPNAPLAKEENITLQGASIGQDNCTDPELSSCQH